MANEEYLTIAEVAALLKCSVKTVRNKISAGVFQKGKHYFTPPTFGPRFKSSAMVEWIEGKDNSQPKIIPLKKGSVLRISINGLHSNN
jgi:Helix-turn-helix domain